MLKGRWPSVARCSRLRAGRVNPSESANPLPPNPPTKSTRTPKNTDLALYIDGKWQTAAAAEDVPTRRPRSRWRTCPMPARPTSTRRWKPPEGLCGVAGDLGLRPRQDHAQGRRPDARAPRRHLQGDGAGAGQGLCRGARRGADLGRHHRLVRRGGPPQLRARRAGPRQGHAPAGAAGAGRRRRRLHAVEFPGAHAGAQGRRRPGGRLLAHPQGVRGDARHLHRDGALLRRCRVAGGRAQPGVRGAGGSLRASPGEGRGERSPSPARSRSASISRCSPPKA